MKPVHLCAAALVAIVSPAAGACQAAPTESALVIDFRNADWGPPGTTPRFPLGVQTAQLGIDPDNGGPTYLARFPRVQELIARTVAQAAADGYVTTLLGRRRAIPELRASNRQTRALGERLAVNTLMQGTAADVIKVAMVRIHERLGREGRAARLVLQVHDELLLEVPEVEVTAVRTLVREEMVGAYPLDPPLAVDVGVGDNWAEAKD